MSSNGFRVYRGSNRETPNHGLRRSPMAMPGQHQSPWHQNAEKQESLWYNNATHWPGDDAKPQDGKRDSSADGRGNGGTPAAQSSGTEKTIGQMLSLYSDKSSISGVPFIKNTKYKSIRVMWTFLLVISVALMTFHLDRLFVQYFEYKTQVQLDFNFSYLNFPAVTICNTNAIRLSELYKTNEKMNNLVNSVEPSEIQKRIDDWTPKYETYYGNSWSYWYGTNNTRRRRKRNAGDDDDMHQNGSMKYSVRTNGFFDDFGNSSWYNESYFYYENDYDDDIYFDSWESESEPAALDKIEDDFIHYYSLLNQSTQFSIGHQIQDMLVKCSFSGRKCYQSNFTVTPSSRYGNCFTLQYDKFIAKQSGPKHGLDLILFLETDQYVPGITNSKGAHVVIHQPNSIPFPDDEGFAISARTHTYVGMRQVDLYRKGSPYGDCQDTQEFFEQHRVVYNRQTCVKLCLHRMIREVCNCSDGTRVLINSVLNAGAEDRLKTCNSTDQMECAYAVNYKFEKQASVCGCNNPCEETTYRLAVTNREWPAPTFAKVISAIKCKENKDLCATFNNRTDEQLQSDFVKLTIYFEDLNHELIEEEPDYEIFQLMSDVGGTIGLWIGLSLLSIFEIVHLIVALLRHALCRKRA